MVLFPEAAGIFYMYILIIQIYIIMRPTDMIHNMSSLASNTGDQSSNHLSTDPREMR